MTLVVNDLSSGYGRQQVLFGLHIDVPPGRLVGVIGPNGAGKSTLIKTLSGGLKCWDGSISWNGKSLCELPIRRRVREGIVAIHQEAPAFTRMTVERNVEVAQGLGKELRNRTVKAKRVWEMFPELADRRRQYAGSLSGGERQLLALARGVCLSPSLLLLDEPSFGLAPGAKARLMGQIGLLRKEGTSCLMVEQDPHMLRDAAAIYFMRSGRVEQLDA